MLYRTLYIGVEETCVLRVKNLSSGSLMYAWGEASGTDTAKMKLCVCPEKGEVAAANTERMKITIVPMEEVKRLPNLLRKLHL